VKTDLAEAALEMGAMGPVEGVISHSHELVLACAEKIYTAPLTPRKTDGRTGRGDTLFCSYLARRTQGGSALQSPAICSGAGVAETGNTRLISRDHAGWAGENERPQIAGNRSMKRLVAFF
jgi:hypothetical protein